MSYAMFVVCLNSKPVLYYSTNIVILYTLTYTPTGLDRGIHFVS